MCHRKLFRQFWKTPRPTARVLLILLWCGIFGMTHHRALQAADAAKPGAVTKPNIVFILTDDQRYDALSCMGNRILRTPHIDKLAADGVLFENMFCTTSICAISRASFLTGQYARRHGITNFRKTLTDDEFAATFPVQLRRAGYRTGMVGKWGLGGQLPADQYDYFKGYKGQGQYFAPGEKGTGKHLTDTHTEQAVEFLNGCTADKPFLLQVYTKAAHCQDGDSWPFQPAPRYNSLFEDVTIPLARTATAEHFNDLPVFLQTSEARNRWKIRFETPELYQKSVKDYYRLVVGLDNLVGQVVETLKEKGLDKNTVIIFTSDNGFYLGEHGLAGKWFMHEESIRLPLVVYDPRLPKALSGRRLEELVLNIDIAPTIFELAGLTAPEQVQGESLVGLLRDEHVPDRDEFFYEHLFEHRAIAQTEGIRTKTWKYTRYISIDPPYEELFDIANDPYEEHNLAFDPEHAARVIEFRQRTDQWAKRVE